VSSALTVSEAVAVVVFELPDVLLQPINEKIIANASNSVRVRFILIPPFNYFIKPQSHRGLTPCNRYGRFHIQQSTRTISLIDFSGIGQSYI